MFRDKLILHVSLELDAAGCKGDLRDVEGVSISLNRLTCRQTDRHRQSHGERQRKINIKIETDKDRKRQT